MKEKRESNLSHNLASLSLVWPKKFHCKRRGAPQLFSLMRLYSPLHLPLLLPLLLLLSLSCNRKFSSCVRSFCHHLFAKLSHLFSPISLSLPLSLSHANDRNLLPLPLNPPSTFHLPSSLIFLHVRICAREEEKCFSPSLPLFLSLVLWRAHICV